MDLTAHTSYVPLVCTIFAVLGALIVLSSVIVGSRTSDYHRALGVLLCSLPFLIIGFIVSMFSPGQLGSGSLAVKTSDFPAMHYVTKGQERSALASLYHVTYVGHDHSGDTYRRSNGSMLYGCATHYTKHTTSVHLDSLTCGQRVMR